MTKIQMALIGLAIASTIPMWRSGGRANLTFWEWVWNHTIFGPPVEYVPKEDYQAELRTGITRRGEN